VVVMDAASAFNAVEIWERVSLEIGLAGIADDWSSLMQAA
jgi:hypothetical protein